MNGDSKFLTLAALGVIGLGSAMPYWSAWSAPEQAPPEITSAQSAATQPAAEPQFTAQQYWDQQVSRPDVVTLTPRGGQTMGLDNPAQIPSLSMDMQQATPVAAQPIMADVPINQVGSVSLASRVEDMDAPRTALHAAVVPIEIPGSAKPLPPTMTSPVITTRQVMKPELPETEVQQQFTPLPRIAPPNHGANNNGSTITREHRVRDGDSLESIAEKYLGDPLLADAVFRANRSQLDSPQLLPIGVTLKIPGSSASEEAPEIDSRLRPMTRLRPVSTASDPRGGDQPWTTLSLPGT